MVTDAVPLAAAVPLPPVPVYAVTVIVQGEAWVFRDTVFVVTPEENVSSAWLNVSWEKPTMYD
jgi:hypothetical protein